MMRANCAGATVVAFAAVCALLPEDVRGDLVQVRVSDSLGRTLLVTDGGLGDQNIDLNAVNIDESLLLLTFPELDLGTAVGASTNAASLTDTFRRLEQTATLIRDDIAGVLDITYTIIATQADFLLPPGSTGFLNTTASATFNNAPTANTISIEAGIDTANQPFVISTSPGPIGPLASAGVFPNAVAGSAGPVPFVDSDFYSITGQAILVTTENSEVQITGAVMRVDSAVVPEPGSLTLAGLLGGIGLLGARLRRRRNAPSIAT